MMLDGYARCLPAGRTADRAPSRRSRKRPADESPFSRTESSSTSTLIEKFSYANNVTWTVHNRLRERTKRESEENAA